MDFVTDLPMTFYKYNAIWVIVDRLAKSAHFRGWISTFQALQVVY